MGLQIRFLIYDELQIEIDPLQRVIEVDSNQVPLTFNVKVNNFGFCNTVCTYTLFDAYPEKVLSKETETLSKLKETTKEYTVDLNMSGVGERIYYFETICKNQRSLLCKTDEKEKARSSLITINRNYTPEEIKSIAELKQKIKLIYKDIITNLNAEKQINETIKAIKSEVNTSLEFSNSLNSSLKKINKAINAYYFQDIEKTNNFLNALPINTKINELTGIQTAIKTFNQNVLILQSFSKEKMNSLYGFYQKTNLSRAQLIKSIVFNVKQMPQNKFEDIVSLNNLKTFNNTIFTLTQPFPEKQLSFEFELNQKITNFAKLLSYNLTNNASCLNTLNLNNKINLHNSIVKNETNGFENIIRFISNNLNIINENETSFIADNISIKNQNHNLSYYLDYIEFPNVSLYYCLNNSELLANNLTNLTIINVSSIEPINDSLNLGNPNKLCCIYKKCSVCSINKTNYPILFLHGHSFNKNDPPESSIDTFFSMQNALSQDELIINAGDIDYSSINEGYWSQMSVPIGVRGTYYYIAYYDTKNLAKSIQKKNEGIESYSIRLKDLIDIVLSQTGAEKVIIVAHSMGGLVTREYLSLFGEDKVEKVMLIGTPNNGVYGKVEKFCGYFGDKKACEDMKPDSVFLKKLNQFTPHIPIHLVIGRGCNTDGEDGDGITQVRSAILPYANITYVNGSCKSAIDRANFHRGLIYPDKFPKVYETVKEFLRD